MAVEGNLTDGCWTVCNDPKASQPPNSFNDFCTESPPLTASVISWGDDRPCPVDRVKGEARQGNYETGTANLVLAVPEPT